MTCNPALTHQPQTTHPAAQYPSGGTAGSLNQLHAESLQGGAGTHPPNTAAACRYSPQMYFLAWSQAAPTFSQFPPQAAGSGDPRRTDESLQPPDRDRLATTYAKERQRLHEQTAGQTAPVTGN